MSLSTPTTQALADQIIADLETSLQDTFPLLPKAFARVLAKVFAAVTVIIYKYCGFILLQLFVAHASFRDTTINGKTVNPLIEWGRLIGVADPSPGLRAEHTITVTVTNQTGSLDGGAQLLRTDTQVLYTVVASVFLDAATVEATIRAVSDPEGNEGYGVVGNLENGDIVSFVNPLANIARDAVVSSQLVAGADPETETAYRGRIIDRFQKKPQGGAYADYEQWAEEVAGIVNVYPYTSPRPGEVDVYCEATEASSGSADGIPTPAQLTAVLDNINLNISGLATRRPANAAVNALAIIRSAFFVEVLGLEAPDEPATRVEINSGIDEHLRSRESFIVGLSVLPRDDRITTAALGGIVDGIVEALGGSVAAVTLRLTASGDPINAYTLGHGEKAKLNGGVATYP